MTMTRTQYWSILAAGVVCFLLVDRVWDNPFAIDRSILWSYGLVALLVPIVLLARRTFSLRNLLLYEIEIILVKYVITTCIAVVFWVMNDPPHPPAPSAAPAVDAAREPPRAPPASVIPAEARRRLSGVVRTEDGGPVANALVYVAEGLETLNFAPPAEPRVVHNQDGRFSPTLSVVHAFQPLSLEVGDGQLHTIAAVSLERETVFSVPMVAPGRSRPYVAGRAHGLVRLYCRVHEDAEAPAYMLVLHHGLTTRTGPDGRFELSDVPALPVRIRALTADVSAEAEEAVAAQDSQPIFLTLQHFSFPRPR